MDGTDLKAPEFPFEMSFGEGEEPIVFQKPKDLEDWAREEEGVWRGAIPLLTTNPDLTNFFNARIALCAQYIADNARRAASGEADRVRIFWEEIARYGNGSTIASDSRLGKFVLSRLKTDPLGALGALLQGTTLGHEIQDADRKISVPNLPEIFNQGRIALRDLPPPSPLPLGNSAEENLKILRKAQDELSETIRAEQLALKNVRDDLDRVMRDVNETLKKAAEAQAEFPSKFTGEIDRARLELQSAVSEISGLAIKTREDAASALNALEEAFRSRQHLKQPIEYWRDKRKEHRRLLLPYAITWGLGTVVFVLGLGSGAWFLFEYLESGYWHLWKFGVTVLYVSLGTWFLRSVAKLFFSAQHLAEEAYEREVMADGLFSLLNDAKSVEALKTRNMRRIVDVLFRPATKGVIKDDGPGLDLNRLVEALGGQRSRE